MPPPRVPAFAHLTVAAALANATYTAIYPLLPLLLPPALRSAPFALALPVAAAAAPAILIHPALAYVLRRHKTAPRPRFVHNLLPAAVLLEAAGTLVLAASRHVPVRLVLAMLLSGAGAAVSQAAIIPHLSDTTPHGPLHHRDVAIHLTLLESCAAFAAILGPLIIAPLHSHSPFLFIGGVQLLVALATIAELRRHRAPHSERPGSALLPISYQTFSNAATPNAPAPQRPAEADDDAGDDPGFLHASRHVWVWLILLAIAFSAASLSFVRPLLSSYVTATLGHSYLYAAAVFSLAALVAVIAETVTSTFLAPTFGARNTIIFGLLTTAAGYQILSHKSWVLLPVTILVLGSSATLLLTFTDLGTITDTRVSGLSESLSTLAAIAFAIGDTVGPLASATLLYSYGTFPAAAAKWSLAVFVTALAVGLPYAIGSLWLYASPRPTAPRFGSRHSTAPAELEPLLG